MEKYGVPASHWAVRLLGLVEQASIWAADHAIAVNDLVLERYTARGAAREKFTVVMNAADERLFPPSSGPYLGGRVPAQPLGLAYHGSLLPYYGLDLVMRALAQVRGRWPYQLHLFGEGPGRDGLAALAAELKMEAAVHFHGRVPQEALAERLGSAAAGIVPTRSGPMLDLSLSNKLMELACMGMPVIAAGLPSYRRYFGEDGVLYFQPGDVSSLAQVLQRFAAMSQGERAALARRVTEVYRPWRWSEQRSRYLTMMRRLAAPAA
jgi:glycosyltransferase involved in cell wall biosynthesis